MNCHWPLNQPESSPWHSYLPFGGGFYPKLLTAPQGQTSKVIVPQVGIEPLKQPVFVDGLSTTSQDKALFLNIYVSKVKIQKYT